MFSRRQKTYYLVIYDIQENLFFLVIKPRFNHIEICPLHLIPLYTISSDIFKNSSTFLFCVIRNMIFFINAVARKVCRCHHQIVLFSSFNIISKVMKNSPKEWFEQAIFDEHINYLEYNKFTDPIEIGTGGFGTVTKYNWKDCELTVALKCLKVDKSLDEKSIKDFIKELKLLQKTHYHPNTIKLYGITKDLCESYNIVLQYADEGNLREYFKRNFAKLEWADKLLIAKGIAFGLLFLHNNNIIHRDLNILMHQGQPKIADFGLSKQTNGTSSTLNSVINGVPAYIDPQCFLDENYKRDMKSDVYSFGIILWEISSGMPPFQHISNAMVVAIHILNGKREESKDGTPPQ
ncbi:kinase-like protein [Gigaspora margarita]|uniref:Kinase-like protein n=2 Tax=Gigaspora margarita TaxID=4874 RepID=A0A8H4AIE1_GIGMA|nr:kinase-like protein [Gigaspora margarita]